MVELMEKSGIGSYRPSAKIKKLESLSGEALADELIAQGVSDPALSVLLLNLKTSKKEADELLRSLGRLHPDVIAENRRIDLYQSELDKYCANLAASMSEDDKTSQIGRDEFTQFSEAKRSYEAQNSILTKMSEALEKEKADLTMHQDPILIHEVAEVKAEQNNNLPK
jgi:hypothetical protein